MLILGWLIIAFGLSKNLYLSMLLVFVAGALLMIVFAVNTSLVQNYVTDSMRGRVMSVYNAAFRGGMPLGSAFSGFLVKETSAPAMMLSNGIMVVLLAAFFSASRQETLETLRLYFRHKGMRIIVGIFALVAAAALAAAPVSADLTAARDKQDLAALDRFIAQYQKAANVSPQSADAQYQLALAQSYAAEVTMEARDKHKSEAYAEAGMEPVMKAVELNGNVAEYHRLHGALCGQVIPANPLMGALKYGQCAKDEIDKAIALDSNLALAYVSRGVGNFYLPSSMGGGVEMALKDFDKALSLNPKLDEAYLWKGVTMRKANRNADARQALEQALKLDPNRAWAKQQLDKTPAK